MASASGGQTDNRRESLRSWFVDWPRYRTDKLTVATAASYVASCCSQVDPRPRFRTETPAPPPLLLTAIYYIQFVYPFREGDFQIRHVQDAPISADTCASRPPVKRFQTYLLPASRPTDERTNASTDASRYACVMHTVCPAFTGFLTENLDADFSTSVKIISYLIISTADPLAC